MRTAVRLTPAGARAEGPDGPLAPDAGQPSGRAGRPSVAADSTRCTGREDGACPSGSPGFFRTKEFPVQGSVSYDHRGGGHRWSRITLTWTTPGGPVRRTRLSVRSDLATRLVSGVKTAK